MNPRILFSAILFGALTISATPADAQRLVKQKTKTTSATSSAKRSASKKSSVSAKPPSKSVANVTLRKAKKDTLEGGEGQPLRLTATKSGGVKAAHMNGAGTYVTGFSQGPGGTMGFGAIRGRGAFGGSFDRYAAYRLPVKTEAEIKAEKEKKKVDAEKAFRDRIGKEVASKSARRVEVAHARKLLAFRQDVASQGASLEQIMKPLFSNGPRPKLEAMQRAHTRAFKALNQGKAHDFQRTLIGQWPNYQTALAKVKSGKAKLADKATVVDMHKALQTHLYATAKPLPKGWGANKSGGLTPTKLHFRASSSQMETLATHPHDFARYASLLVKETTATAILHRAGSLRSSNTPILKKFLQVEHKVEAALQGLRENTATRADMRVLKEWLPIIHATRENVQ